MIGLTASGCSGYKPYLPEQYRTSETDPTDQSPTLPGIFTGKKREWVIY